FGSRYLLVYSLYLFIYLYHNTYSHMSQIYCYFASISFRDGLQIRLDKSVDLPIKHPACVALFILSTSIFDKRIWMQYIVSDLTSPVGRFAGSEFADTCGVLLDLELRQLGPKYLHGCLFVLELGTFILD